MKRGWPARFSSMFSRVVVVAMVMVMALVGWGSGSGGAEAKSTTEAGHGEQALQEAYAALSAGKRVETERSYRTPEKPTVYLTFDDGPSELTPKVLDVLKEHGVPATFFVVGAQVEARPEVLKRIVKEGHAVGNHSYNHSYKELYSSFEGYWSQLKRTEEVLLRTAGVRTSIARAPGGTFSNFDHYYFYYLQEAGYHVYDWSIDSGDSRRVGVPAAEIVANVQKGPFRHEVNVLMHDGAGHGETLKALPDIIRTFRDQGYTFAAMDEQVKPDRFSVVKSSRWPRHTTLETFKTTTEDMREHLAARLKEAAPLDKGRAAEGLAGRLKSADGDVLEGGARATAGSAGAVQSGGPVDSAGLAGLAVSAGFTGSGGAAEEAAGAVTEDSAFSTVTAMDTIRLQQVMLRIGNRLTELEASELLLREHRLIVPLRALAEALGAKVEWSESSRTAAIEYGTHRAEYDLSRLQLRSYEQVRIGMTDIYRSMQVTSLPELELRDGSLYVPMRAALQQLGVKVLAYEAASERAAVVQAGRPQRMGMLVPSVPMILAGYLPVPEV
ncbi:polysaccharide deacetylase family protein [Paenibacillus sp. YYML68]|uniref:polysaccharide deacetylase family protein n=1 Tax=Paenibacillus sp. YYML68 TaxID=2909250 RepID=UPI002491B71B|nr:polysaccharide deacetylase family protein [Paenibacillus sp. YYML68]